MCVKCHSALCITPNDTFSVYIQVPHLILFQPASRNTLGARGHLWRNTIGTPPAGGAKHAVLHGRALRKTPTRPICACARHAQGSETACAAPRPATRNTNVLTSFIGRETVLVSEPVSQTLTSTDFCYHKVGGLD